MKSIISIAVSMLLCIFCFILSSCDNNDEPSPSVPLPISTLAEVGEENCKEATAGADLHLEGDVSAEGLIARIDVTVASEAGSLIVVKKSWTDGKYIGVRNTTFHEHLDIPANTKAGNYKVTFVVTDKLGQSSTFISELKIVAPVEGAPKITFKEIGEGNSMKAKLGEAMHLEAQVDAPHKIAKIEVELHNSAAGYEHSYIYAEKYLGQTSVLFHEHPVIPADAPAGEYHIHFTVTDGVGNVSTTEAEGIEISNE